MYHMDMKPANILLDNHMVPKITDFGLSRLDIKSQTMSTIRFGSLGYCAPEYLNSGKMSFKSDIFGLGVIITQLVTGHKDIHDNNKNNVLRRWRHRWKKSGNETLLAYQQVAYCLGIGLLCQNNDPSKRPFIRDLIHDIREMEGVDGTISNAYEYTNGQISPYSEDDMLGVEPLELHFPFEINKVISCSLKLTNQTNACIAFNIEKMSSLPYCTQPNKCIVPPRSECSVDITLHLQNRAPWNMQRADEFTVWSTIVPDDLAPESISADTFSKESGVVDAVNLDVVFGAEESNEVNDDHATEDVSTNMINKVTDIELVEGVKHEVFLVPTPSLEPGTSNQEIVNPSIGPQAGSDTTTEAPIPTSESKFGVRNFIALGPKMDPNSVAGKCKEVVLSIHEIYAGRQVSFEEVYRTAFHLVMYKHGEELYSAVEAVIASEVEGLGRALSDVAPDGMLFLEELLAKWQLHKRAASMSCLVLLHMEKHFVPANHKTPVYELALRLWRDNVVRSNNVLPRLIAEVRQQRDGEDAAADLAGVAEMLKELGDEVYHQVMGGGAPAVAE